MNQDVHDGRWHSAVGTPIRKVACRCAMGDRRAGGCGGRRACRRDTGCGGPGHGACGSRADILDGKGARVADCQLPGSPDRQGGPRVHRDEGRRAGALHRPEPGPGGQLRVTGRPPAVDMCRRRPWRASSGAREAPGLGVKALLIPAAGPPRAVDLPDGAGTRFMCSLRALIGTRMRRADLDHQPLGSLAGRGRRSRGKAGQPGRHPGRAFLRRPVQPLRDSRHRRPGQGHGRTSGPVPGPDRCHPREDQGTICLMSALSRRRCSIDARVSMSRASLREVAQATLGAWAAWFRKVLNRPSSFPSGLKLVRHLSCSEVGLLPVSAASSAWLTRR